MYRNNSICSITLVCGSTSMLYSLFCMSAVDKHHPPSSVSLSLCSSRTKAQEPVEYQTNGFSFFLFHSHLCLEAVTWHTLPAWAPSLLSPGFIYTIIREGEVPLTDSISLSLSPTYLTLILWKNIQKTHLVLKHLHSHTYTYTELQICICNFFVLLHLNV